MEDFDKFVKNHLGFMDQKLGRSQGGLIYDYDINYSRLRHKCDITKNSPTEATTNERLLFATEFKNNSDTTQSYSFKAERETECVVQSTVNTGVTFKGDVKLTLQTPNDVMEHYAGLKKVLKLDGTVQQTLTDSVKWSVDNMISVPAYTTLKGELVVHEQSLVVDYDVHDIVSGKVLVTVKNPAADNAFVRVENLTIAEIVKAIKDDKNQPFYHLKKKIENWKVEKDRVVVPTTVTVNYSYAVKQDVNVTPVY